VTILFVVINSVSLKRQPYVSYLVAAAAAADDDDDDDDVKCRVLWAVMLFSLV